MSDNRNRFRDEDGRKVKPKDFRKKRNDNKWLDSESQDLYNRWRVQFFKWKNVEWEDLDVKMKNKFRHFSVISRKKSGEIAAKGNEAGNVR